MAGTFRTALCPVALMCLCVAATFPLCYAGQGSGDRAVNGGTTCAGCTILVGVIEQLAVVHSSSIAGAIEKLCEFLPHGALQKGCHALIQIYAPVIIEMLENKETPDVVCQTLHLCYQEEGHEMCWLFPKPHQTPSSEKMLMYQMKVRTQMMKHGVFHSTRPNLCNIPMVSKLCEWIDGFVDKHLPIVDVDGDKYSPVEYLRGSNWRGRDCEDIVPHSYPGAKPANSDMYRDSNCNGIYGTDDMSGEAYEDMFCKGSGPMGIAVLGDSASAHFHIPKEWVTPAEMSIELFSYLPYVLQNEFDWPMTSFMTGFRNTTWPILEGPTESLYMLLKERNRCNHRDYQNLGVNGADSHNMIKNQESLARNQNTDYPLLLWYALIGNDVCNSGPNSVERMTTPDEMRSNVLKTLSFLNGTLPAGSHLIFLGLADGRALYDNLHNRLYPLGELKQDVTYAHFYDYLDCLQKSPCAGWMTTNATLRDLTSKRATELSEVLKNIAETQHYPNFDMHYIDNPVRKVLDDWEATHGPNTAWQLIEPVDGFHPNQFAQPAIARTLWNYLETNLPNVIGKVNPHNEDIKAIFGDQGGH